MLSLAALHQRRRYYGGLLLSVLLVLLPLRGWAEASIHLSGPGGAVSLAPVSASQTLPCHTPPHGQHDTDAAAVEAATACALCVTCHACAVPVSESCGVLRDPPGLAPTDVHTGHSPPSLPLPERPPRA